MTALELLIIISCVLVLLFLSAVESAISQLGVVTLKMLAEKQGGKDEILNLINEDDLQVITPLHVGTQAATLTLAVFITLLSIQRLPVYGAVIAFALLALATLLFRHIIPRLLTGRDPERALLVLLPAFRVIYRFLRTLSFPVSSALAYVRKKQPLPPVTAAEAEEATSEAIQAYIDVGEAEGILEKDDSRLIQSVVEFGDTLVKEVMTSRTQIVAISEKATLRELRDLIVREKHSRIPVYRDQIDQIIGIAYVRNLLSYWDEGSGDAPLASILLPVYFVPETKRVRELLRELQASGDHMAIVIDEFGGVAGLVTIEDLLEEIVGEIRDEDETPLTEVAPESQHSYVLRGGAELRTLEELFDLDLGDVPYSTVSGLVVSTLGRVPSAGEVIDYNGFKVEVLEADRKKIHRLRVQRVEAAVTHPKENNGKA